MSQPADQRFAPPSAPVADVSPAGTALVLASRWSRLGALLIDVILLIVLGQMLKYLWDYPAQLAIQMTQEIGQQGVVDFYTKFHVSQAMLNLIGYASFLLLNGYLLATRGQTIGKMALGLRIARTDGSVASPVRLLLLRYGLGYYAFGLVSIVISSLFALADAFFIFGSARRCLHDRIAGTIVVQAN